MKTLNISEDDEQKWFPLIIVNLNIRGLEGGTKASYLRHIIACESAKFVSLQETKTNTVLNARYFTLWGDNKIG